MKYISKKEAETLFSLIELIENNKVRTFSKVTESPWPYVWVESVSVEGDRFFKEEVFKTSGLPPKPFEIDENYISKEYIKKNLI